MPEHLLREAIWEELNYFPDKQMWQPADYSEFTSKPDATLVRMRWVLCNKGDDQDPDLRARLVACEIIQVPPIFNNFVVGRNHFAAPLVVGESRHHLLPLFLRQVGLFLDATTLSIPWNITPQKNSLSSPQAGLSRLY